MSEAWRPVAGYEGVYEVSDLGRVRSLVRKGRRQTKVLKQNPNTYGHLSIQLCKDGKKKTHHVHRLVAIAFLDPPKEGEEVCHGKKGKQDNSVGNLSWGTHRKNLGEDKNRDNVYSSRYPGVSCMGDGRPRTWIAYIYLKKECVWRKCFHTEIEAYEERQRKLKELDLR